MTKSYVIHDALYDDSKSSPGQQDLIEVNDIKDLLWNNLQEIHTWDTAMVDLKTKALEAEEKELEAKKIEAPESKANAIAPKQFDWDYSETEIEKLATRHNTFVSDLITRQLEPFKKCADEIIARTDRTIQAFHGLSLTKKDLQDISIVANKYRALLQSKIEYHITYREIHRSSMSLREEELYQVIKTLTDQDPLTTIVHNSGFDTQTLVQWDLSNTLSSLDMTRWKDKLHEGVHSSWTRLVKSYGEKLPECEKTYTEMSFTAQREGSQKLIDAFPEIFSTEADKTAIYNLGEEMAELRNAQICSYLMDCSFVTGITYWSNIVSTEFFLEERVRGEIGNAEPAGQAQEDT